MIITPDDLDPKTLSRRRAPVRARRPLVKIALLLGLGLCTALVLIGNGTTPPASAPQAHTPERLQ